MAELQAKPRAFADAWVPAASTAAADVAAARAAGYAGDEASLRVTGARLRRDSRIRNRIETRLGRTIEQAMEEAMLAAQPSPSLEVVQGALAKGRGRGTATERIELLMAMGRRKKASIKERVEAIRLAAELEGELRSRGAMLLRPPVSAPTDAPQPSTGPVPRRHLALVLNPLDQTRSRG